MLAGFKSSAIVGKRQKRGQQLGLTHRASNRTARGKAHPKWGGRRPGAGRPVTKPNRVPHHCRPALASRHPVHVTFKVEPDLPNLRTLIEPIEECLRAGKEQGAFRLVHYSVQALHLHLIVEASNMEVLAAGVKGLSVRIARRVNKELGRRGRVFVERYHLHILKTPRETRAALAYVLNNVRHHASQRGERSAWSWIDHCSSGRFFDGWRAPPGAGPFVPTPIERETPVAVARTRLITTGWRKHGLLSVNAVPG
jgi:hypothetical protein